MGIEISDLEQSIRTLADASKESSNVSVGDFAQAVQRLQAELKMLETEVDRLGSTVGHAFSFDEVEDAAEAAPQSAVEPQMTASEAVASQDAAATKP